MRLALFGEDGSRNVCDFEPGAHRWSRQAAGAAHLVGLETGLTKDLAKAFVKRWDKAAAPANKLLMQAITNPLPNTPRILGHCVLEKDHYYFFANLSDKHRLLDKVMRTPVSARMTRMLVEQNLGLVVCKSAAQFLRAINDRGYVYPDFTHKNIMISGGTACSFIDVDSCFAAGELPTNMRSAGRFAMTYWGAWREVVRVHTAQMLSQTMVLSFAVVWGRAAGLSRQGADPVDVQNTVLNPTFDQVQSPFWAALERGSVGDFAAFFGVEGSPQARSLFGDWKALLARLRLGESPEWGEVVAMAEATLKLGREAPLVSAPAPAPKTPRSTSKPQPPPPRSPPPPPTPPPRAASAAGAPPSAASGSSAPAVLWRTPAARIAMLVAMAFIAVGVAWIANVRHVGTNSPGTAGDPAVQGPSFNCSVVKSWVLKTVCADDQLKALDRQLASRYGVLLTDPSIDKDALVHSERRWIRLRQRCTNSDCIKTLYQRRLSELETPPASTAVTPASGPPNSAPPASPANSAVVQADQTPATPPVAATDSSLPLRASGSLAQQSRSTSYARADAIPNVETGRASMRPMPTRPLVVPPSLQIGVTGVAGAPAANQLEVDGRTLRLFGVDAPTRPQNLDAFRQFLARDGELSCRPISDGYICTDAQGRDIGGMVVNNGLAASDDARYNTAENHARQLHRGIWASP